MNDLRERANPDAHAIDPRVLRANEVAHPCAKPIRMMLWLVERASLEGMTILDPFMGSGTTGVAAIQKHRNFIGIEINPDYCAVARKRLEMEAAQLTLFGASGAIVPSAEQATMFAGVLP